MVELTALSSTCDRATATFLNFCVLRGSTVKFLRGGNICYRIFCT